MLLTGGGNSGWCYAWLDLHRSQATSPMQPQQGSPTAPLATAEHHKAAGLKADLVKLALDAPPEPLHAAARLRNYFLTGVVIAGPIALTFYITWHVINAVDAWVRPFLPRVYDPDSYLPFSVPGIGLVLAIIPLTVIGALATRLFGRSLFSAGELMLRRLPIVRNIYSGLSDIFTSVLAAASLDQTTQNVALVQFPSRGIWSLSFITGDAAVAIKTGVLDDSLISVFIPHGLLPPSGITCFIPRKHVIPLRMSVEDAAKIIFSVGLAHPQRDAHPPPPEDDRAIL